VRSKLEGRWIRNLGHRLIGSRARIPAYLCDTTICVSNAVRNALVERYGFPPRKTIAIRNGVSLFEFTPDATSRDAVRAGLGIHPGDLLLVCSARLSEEKGLDILLAAMNRLVRKGARCKCLILGEGQLKTVLEKQIQTLELTSHVRLHGFHPDVRPYLNAADIFVLTSYVEGLPLAVLEAMACGLPCVVTDAGGSAEAVTHNVQGLVVQPGSAQEVEAALSYLIAHPQERDRMSRAARARACEQFDVDRQMANIKKVILGGDRFGDRDKQ
jgi:glycosyltransferase involved in cell wall biosynthesis